MQCQWQIVPAEMCFRVISLGVCQNSRKKNDLNFWDLHIKICTDDKNSLFTELWIINLTNNVVSHFCLCTDWVHYIYTHIRMLEEEMQPHWLTGWPIQHILSPLANKKNKQNSAAEHSMVAMKLHRDPADLLIQEKISNLEQSNKTQAFSVTHKLDNCRGR